MNGNTKQIRSLIFLHIPKTAGTTLNSIIKRFKSENTAVLSFAEFKQLPKPEREKIVGIDGSLPRPYAYITMLRDPIDRIISYYYYVVRDRDTEHHNAITSRKMTLKEFVSSDLTIELENDQTRYLSAIDQIDQENSFELSPDEILNKAKKNLDEYFAVAGLSERFDETLILLKENFGWRNLFYFKRNVTRNRPRKVDIPKEVLSIIEKRNALDVELYRYAKERFDQQIRQLGSSFEKELKRFKSLNGLFCTFYGNPYMRLYDFFHPIRTGFWRWYRTDRSRLNNKES